MSEGELIAKVRGWLDKQGYPLELSVGRIFEKQGWETNHQTWYSDDASGVTREVDLLATRSLTAGDNSRGVAFSLVVECKRSRDKPWVVLSSPIGSAVALRSPFPRWISGDAYGVARLKAKVLPPRSLLPPRDRIGHGLVAALTDGKENAPTSPYSALRSVANAAHALDRERGAMSLAMQAYFPFVPVFAPLLVVDGPLFECFLDTTGSDTIVEEASTSCVICPDDPPGRLDVSIVSISSLESFIVSLTPQVDEFLAALLPHVADIIATHKGRKTTDAQSTHGRKGRAST